MLRTFKEFCEFMEDLGKPKEARGQITEYLRNLTSSNQVVACNFMMGIPLEKKTTGFNKKMVLNTINEYYVVPDKKYATLGDMFEVGLNPITIMQPSLQSVHSLYENLAVHGKDKKDRLQGCLITMSNIEKKYFVNILLDKLRVRVGMGVIAYALADIYNVDRKYVSNLYKKYESMVDVMHILVNKDDELVVGKPLKPQLAKDISQNMDKIVYPILAEPKFDGSRAQIHVFSNGDISIYSRSLKDKTKNFPDVIEQLKKNNVQPGIYDGEIFGVNSDGSPMPFNKYQHRMNKENVTYEDLQLYPVTIRLFDIIMLNGVNYAQLLAQDVRTSTLKQLYPNISSYSRLINNEDELIEFHHWCITSGQEGIMLKKLTGAYLFGQGKSSFGNWFKYKPTQLRFDVVITGVQWGSGDNMDVLSSFDIAVREKSTVGSQISFRSIGRCGGGFTREVYENITNKILVLQPDVFIEPESYIWYENPIIIEVKSEKVYRNTIGNIGLRFPQFMGFRNDKDVNDIDTVEMVEQYIGE